MKEFFLKIGMAVLAAMLVYVTFDDLRQRRALARVEEQVRVEHEKHERNLADATNSIELASSEYNAVRSERDRLLERLRSAASGGGRETVAVCADTARASALERMVRDLSDLVARCDSGWNACARRKDALVEAVKQ
jgi:hypothetical protein